MFVVQVDDGVSLHTVGVSGSGDPCECPGNFFDKEVVLTSVSLSPLLDLEAIFENVLWIRILLPAVPRCLSLFVVSLVG